MKKFFGLIACALFFLSLQSAFAVDYNYMFDLYGVYADEDFNNTADMNIAFKVRSCNDAVCNGESFVGPDNTVATWFTTNFQSTIRWDLNAITSNRWFQYTFRLLSYDGNFSPRVYNTSLTYDTMDVNIWKVDGRDFNAELPSFSYAVDKNLSIQFKATDSNGNRDLNFNMWYDTSANGKTNKIIGDINLSTNTAFGNCDSNNKTTGMVCNWDWNISGITDANYFITIEINDGSNSNTTTSSKSFRVNPVPPSNTCSCPASGHWEILNGDICTLATQCNLSGGGLHIISGSLNITATGTLTIPTGQKLVIQKASENKLYIEKGGRLVINK